mmetsp:Transcript_28319/g.45365  ORF Transcript_28319/g.45365 Transcript_28319/m.45365 type:complete len:196 (-) Transcript_28319:150-737(-)
MQPCNAKNRNHDNITDMCVIGIRNDVIAVLGDVSIVHPIEGVKPYKCKSGAATKEGAAVRRLEQKKEKDATYKEFAIRKHYLYIAMGLETYGRLGPDFIAFLTSIAEIAAKRSEDLHSVPTMPSMRQQFIARQLHSIDHRYKRQISLVRVRGMANRIKSAVFEKQHHRTGQPVADECTVRGAGLAVYHDRIFSVY